MNKTFRNLSIIAAVIVLIAILVVYTQRHPTPPQQPQGETTMIDVSNEALVKSVTDSDLSTLQALLNTGTYDINAMNSKQETLILIATHNNNIPIAQLLIDKGANVNLQDTIHDSAYLYAGAQGRTEILDYMLRHADIDFSVVNRYGGNTLIPAAEKGHIDAVRLLVANPNIDINFQNNFGYTALIEAVALTDGSEVFQDIVQLLVDHGADTNLRDKSGKTALDYAQERQFETMITILQ
ncbi:ankyrin repeat domain-containing protein [Erysipelothrix aquatica]|uniref:ankyrin repeat domain-containing protein n=1 Tax=Erysipelothrix aquatica TaxID=2683714 RepID=UPI001359D9F1|nr:ankyrin repeat domain-containing protein [Erysipelothrix aquatica]